MAHLSRRAQVCCICHEECKETKADEAGVYNAKKESWSQMLWTEGENEIKFFFLFFYLNTVATKFGCSTFEHVCSTFVLSQSIILLKLKIKMH